ncbi:Sec-independent protein translocase protein TatB [Robbsia sp. Bb-Pol-6]|uniref:Sec-independent protein translocase protein TatB n=1 Tax=Robbsia betulipollinis TaxID=2981849 RepID=A0ABT3ZPF8_9BURK|nr:Sec-independent protein translocase protein TatB [Robbsia betulipollinis]MCY0388362.1 Sec-independent protein translocase protein TatB [Robbsia betulipollinis]
MLDLGLSKLAIIGVVALVVIGPEKLPRVARTAGALLGRAQRYINDVKTEVSREMDMGDLKSAKSAFEDAARSAQSSVQDHLRETEDHLNETWRTLSPDPVPGSEAANAPPAIGATAASDHNPSGYSVYEGSSGDAANAAGSAAQNNASADAPIGYGTHYSANDGGAAQRRRNWRVKQAAPPAWFKRTQLVRTRLQSGAARVARHRPDGLRQPTRFL